MRSKRGGWSLNTYLKQVGERESMITKTVEKPPVHPETFLGHFGKAGGSHWEPSASAVSLLIVTSV